MCANVLNLCPSTLSYRDKRLREGPSGVLGHVDGGDDPVPLHAFQLAAVVGVPRREHDLRQPWSHSRHRLRIRHLRTTREIRGQTPEDSGEVSDLSRRTFQAPLLSQAPTDLTSALGDETVYVS